MSTLLTFLGRGQVDESGDTKSYKSTRYQLPDGSQTGVVTFLGQALVDYYRPGRLIVAGTSGSMWDELSQKLGDAEYTDEEQMLLMESFEQQNVSETQLARLQTALQGHLGCEVTLLLLPDGATPAEQLAFITRITQAVNEGERLIIDVTHGFRFMPILAFAAIQYLQKLRGVTVEAMLYGAYSPGASQVFDLQNVLQLANWVTALAQYDHSGDLGVLAPLLAEQGWSEPQTAQLKKGAFLERVTNSSDAQRALGNVLDTGLEGELGQLIQPLLAERLAWTRQPARGDRECALANEYLERGDYLRAVIYAQEGLISRYLFKKKLSDNDYEIRDQAKEALKADYGDPFHSLLNLRNNLAHGTRSNEGRTGKAVNRAVRDRQQLEQLLGRIFRELKVCV